MNNCYYHKLNKHIHPYVGVKVSGDFILLLLSVLKMGPLPLTFLQNVH